MAIVEGKEMLRNLTGLPRSAFCRQDQNIGVLDVEQDFLALLVDWEIISCRIYLVVAQK